MNNPDMPAGSRGAGKPAQVAWSGDASLIMPEPWMQQSVCAEVDPDIFFPNQGDGPTADMARSLCGRCPVADECLSFALATNQRHGIWGGLTTNQRGRLAKRSAS